METEVLVVGGGSTGVGVARDLTLRGLDVTLVERGTLAAGTTGRMHGLLHSGARYAESDPTSARDCAAENRVLREVAPDCVAATGGLFAALPGDDDYVEQKLAACEACGVAAEVVSGEAAREVEPALSADVTRAVRVPDATVDPFRLVAATALDARERGARVELGTAVTDLRVADGRVVGAALDRDGETERVRADHVVNATGGWADRLAATAGCSAPVRHSQGAMVVVDAGLDAVVNWCRPKGEADIAVPHGGRAVLGTTDEPVPGPDAVSEDPEDVGRLVKELARLVPAVGDADVCHAYWGVRPLADLDAGETTDASRDFAVVDHDARDGVAGFTSVVGGKVTTHRLMAERVGDAVCEALGVEADCRSAATPLPAGGAVDDAMAAFGLDRTPRPPVAVDGGGTGL